MSYITMSNQDKLKEIFPEHKFSLLYMEGTCSCYYYILPDLSGFYFSSNLIDQDKNITEERVHTVLCNFLIEDKSYDEAEKLADEYLSHYSYEKYQRKDFDQNMIDMSLTLKGNRITQPVVTPIYDTVIKISQLINPLYFGVHLREYPGPLKIYLHTTFRVLANYQCEFILDYETSYPLCDIERTIKYGLIRSMTKNLLGLV